MALALCFPGELVDLIRRLASCLLISYGFLIFAFQVSGFFFTTFFLFLIMPYLFFSFLLRACSFLLFVFLLLPSSPFVFFLRRPPSFWPVRRVVGEHRCV